MPQYRIHPVPIIIWYLSGTRMDIGLYQIHQQKGQHSHVCARTRTHASQFIRYIWCIWYQQVSMRVSRFQIPNSIRNLPVPIMTTRSSDRVHLILMGDGSVRPFIGVHGVPGRMPQLLRLPGETADAFTTRALHAVTGTDALWAALMYDDHPPPLGSSSPKLHTGRNEREIASVGHRATCKHYS